MPQIEIDQDLIDSYQEEALDFFAKVLDMDADKVLLTDESSLSDFSFHGVPMPSIDEPLTLRQRNKLWDDRLLAKVESIYGLKLASTTDRLIVVFEQLRQCAKPPTLQ